MRRLAILSVAIPLLSQSAKPPRPAPSPVPARASAVAWSYETPPGFHLLEPAYRLPFQIKQALVQFVQPVPALTQEYQTVFQDKQKFSAWMNGVLLDYRTRRMKQAKSEGKVLSSDPSTWSADGGTMLSTSKAQPRKATDLDEVQRYLDVLKLWAPA
jgi:hypothetical protein